MSNKKYVIWSDNLDFEDWRSELEAEYPDRSEDELVQIMYLHNDSYLDDERENLDVELARPILVIADMGLWDGRRPAYQVIKSGNIRDCLYTNCDTATWFVDELGDLRCDAVHHDGTNRYLYRVYKDGVSDDRIERLKEKILAGTATRADITRVTARLGDVIGEVYGWDMPRVGATAAKPKNH